MAKKVFTTRLYHQVDSLPTIDSNFTALRFGTDGKIYKKIGTTETELGGSTAQALTSTRIAFGSATNLVTESADLTWNNAAKDLYVNGDAHIGGVNGIARLNVTASATGSIFNGSDNAGVSRFQVHNDGTLGAFGHGGNYFYWSSLGNLIMNSDGGYTPTIDLKRNGISELAIQTLYGSPRITFANSLSFHDFAGNGLFFMSDAYNYSLRKFNVNVNGNAMLNVKSTLSNGTSKIFEGYNSNEALKVVMSDEGSAWFGGVNGAARLNITASGTGGASKILSGYDNGNIETFSVYDNGNTHIGGSFGTAKLNITGVPTDKAISVFANSGVEAFYVKHDGTLSGQGILITDDDTRLGILAGYTITTPGLNRVSIGVNANRGNIGGMSVAIGVSALANLSTDEGVNASYAVSSGFANLLQSQNQNQTVSTGAYAGFQSVGSNNIYHGYRIGAWHTGNGCIYIGNDNVYAGLNGLTENNRLRINNLIYGEFDNQLLRVNGRLDVTNSVWLGGSYGVARLNVTASGTGETSKAISVFDNGGTEKASIWDNGNTEIKGTLSVQGIGRLSVNNIVSTGVGSSKIEVQRNGVNGIVLHSSDGANPAEYNRLYFNKYIEVMDINASDYMVAYNQTGNWTLNKAASNYFGQLGLWGTARMNVCAVNDNGTSIIHSGFNSSGTEVFKVLDNGNTWFGGVNGVARLNVTAAGAYGASKIISGFDVNGSENFIVYDDGGLKTPYILADGTAYGATALGKIGGYGTSNTNSAVVVGNGAGSTTMGAFNTIVGTYAGGKSGSTHSHSVIMGCSAASNSDQVTGAVIIGTQAAYAGGTYSVAIGFNANSSGASYGGIILGYYAGYTMTSSSVAIGSYTAEAITSNPIIAIGASAGRYITGGYNIAIGENSLYSHDNQGSGTSSHCLAIGYNAGWKIRQGADANILLGNSVGYSLETGFFNTLVGVSCAQYLVSGNYNTMIGHSAGLNYNGSSSVFIGYGAGHYASGDNRLYVANTSTNTPLIYGEFDNSLLRINGTLDVTTGYKINNVAGVSGTWTTVDGKTITATNGLITSIL